MKVFLCEYIHPKAYELLQSKAEIVEDFDRIHEVDAIINRNLHIDGELMKSCPNLKVIGIHGTGKDGVDLEAAARLGVKVVYVPYENADSVAELIIGFMIAAARKIALADRMVLAGKVTGCAPEELKGVEIAGKTFGMVGCGDIAMRAARRLQKGFAMRLVGYSPSLTDEKASKMGIERCSSINEVFERSDFVNLGVHLNNQTRGLIRKENLMHAKKGCILLNTSRGEVIDEHDLYEALTDGTLYAAACDVFVKEPPTPDNKLVGLPNFLATPHIGANTEEALYRVGKSVVMQIIDVLEGREATHEYKG